MWMIYEIVFIKNGLFAERINLKFKKNHLPLKALFKISPEAQAFST